MADLAQYSPGLVSEAQVRKDGEKWTLILVRELRHAPEKVWQALTDPEQLRQWAPFDANGNLGAAGTVNLTWLGTGRAVETTVTRAEPPRVLEYNDTRWELEPHAGGTRLTLWHSIDRRYISWGAAGWHICFEVLAQVLSGIAVARIAGGDAMKLGSWQKLKDAYAKHFGAELPTASPQPAQKS